MISQQAGDNNSLTLRASDVLDIGGNELLSGTGFANQLAVLGNSGDAVNLVSSEHTAWAYAGQVSGFDAYINDTSLVFVDPDASVQVVDPVI